MVNVKRDTEMRKHSGEEREREPEAESGKGECEREIKLLRAYGGCLGIRRRRRT